MSGIKRAVTDELRLERHQNLIQAAWDMFQTLPYNDINIVDVAHRVGLAKGTVYLYFKTKEELFLAVEEWQLSEWFQELSLAVDTFSGKFDTREIAGLICGTLAKRPALTRLMVMVQPILERNVPYETVRKCKQELIQRLTLIGGKLEKAIPGLSKGRGVQLFLWGYALVIGLEQASNPTPVVQKVLQNEKGMEALQMDFECECRSALAAMLQGIQILDQKENKND